MRFLSIEPLLEDLGEIDLGGIDWAIVGGESGPGARPMRVPWVEAIRLECVRAGVPFFFKQWGGVQKKRAGRVLHGRTFDEMPERSSISVSGREVRRRLAEDVRTMANDFDDRVLVKSSRLVRQREARAVGA